MEERLEDSTLRRLLEVGPSLVSKLELERVLARILEAAVELTGARYAALGVVDSSRSGLERFLHLGIDEPTRERIGELPTGQGVLGLLITDPEPIRLAEVSEHPRSFGFPEDHPEMHTFLGVPITVGGRQWGALYVTEKQAGAQFDAEDERAAVALAVWASIAIGNAHSVATERLRFAMDAAEQERLQWARELHDETLQGLAAVRLMLATGARSGGEALGEAVRRSIEQIDTEIAAMRALISDLRPGSLGELGIASALEGLAGRIESRSSGVGISVAVPDQELDRAALSTATEVAIYRVAQEATTNAIRHGGAGSVKITLTTEPGGVSIAIRDDGAGFDPASADLGYGIIGMRERASLAGGELSIDSIPGRGTTVSLAIPLEGA